MLKYAQILPSGVVHTIMEASGQLEDVGAVEVSGYDAWYVGSYFDGTDFMRLEVSLDNSGGTALNTPLSVRFRWAKKNGQTASRSCAISVSCNGLIEKVEMVSGEGLMSFESAEPGIFELIAVSPEGIIVERRVTVA